MYYLESQGTPWEIGVNHGTALRNEIAQAYRDWKIEDRGRNKETQEMASRMQKYLEDNLPDLIEEMSGIAEAADLPFEKVFWLTCFNSMRFTLEECSAMAVRNANGGAVVGKTHDIDAVEQRYVLVHKIVEKDAIPRINIGSVGSVWSYGGVNAGGIAFGTTSTPPVSKHDGRGMPQHISGFHVLKHCRTVEDVIDEMSRTTFAGKGLNMVFGDALGGAAAIEKVSTFQSVEKASDSPVFRTNHYLDKKMEAAVGVKGNSGENSRQRYERLSEILMPGRFDDAVAKLKGIVSDTTEPGAICRASTLSAWVLDPKASVAWICSTNPEPEGFVCFRI
jgi:isopenicillin-N N-acyltransferase-like protein